MQNKNNRNNLHFHCGGNVNGGWRWDSGCSNIKLIWSEKHFQLTEANINFSLAVYGGFFYWPTVVTNDDDDDFV